MCLSSLSKRSFGLPRGPLGLVGSIGHRFGNGPQFGRPRSDPRPEAPTPESAAGKPPGRDSPFAPRRRSRPCPRRSARPRPRDGREPSACKRPRRPSRARVNRTSSSPSVRLKLANMGTMLDGSNSGRRSSRSAEAIAASTSAAASSNSSPRSSSGCTASRTRRKGTTADPSSIRSNCTRKPSSKPLGSRTRSGFLRRHNPFAHSKISERYAISSCVHSTSRACPSNRRNLRTPSRE